jgi:two-component system, sensor histidine kinase and response regulator
VTHPCVPLSPSQRRTLKLLTALRVTLRRTRCRASSRDHVSADLSGPHVARLETLQDVHWAIHEREARYRDLLDSQSDVILRRDQEGRLTYANGAFAKVFGDQVAVQLGQMFSPLVLEADVPRDQIAREPNRSGSARVELVQTTSGPRWFEFETQTIATPGTKEIQIIGRDVTERRQAARELEYARVQADAANRAKSRFLAAMSHEIRTPMGGILGMASLMRDTTLTPDQMTFVDAIEGSARTLKALIDDILDFSKIEAGKLELEQGTFRVIECIQDVVELLAPQAKAKGIDIAWAIDPSVPTEVIGDAARVRQILTNLAGNAVKFTAQGGVLVTVAVDADMMGRKPDGAKRFKFCVTDSGPGIQPSTLETLFAEFEQGDLSSEAREGGTGLGLAISRQLARAMGGDVLAVSQLGEGSTFTAHVSFKTVPGSASASADTSASRVVHDNAHVLLIMPEGVEREAMLLTLSGAGIPCEAAYSHDAPAMIQMAAAMGEPFTLLIGSSRTSIEAFKDCLATTSAVGVGAPTRAAVVLEPTDKDAIAVYRAAGVASYLVRPVRPRSLLQICKVHGGHAVWPKGDEDRLTALAELPEASAHCSLRILMAEDNDINAMLARRMLESVGCYVTRARNGDEALSQVRAATEPGGRAFDMILMDVQMPVVDGLTATRRIRTFLDAREHRPAAQLPIIALTANAFAEDRAACLAAGMDDYLSKPFERAELHAILARWAGYQVSASRSHVG